MLFLTADPSDENNTIHIGDNMSITIMSVKGKHVKIGFKVPDDVTVLRDKVRRRNNEPPAT